MLRNSDQLNFDSHCDLLVISHEDDHGSTVRGKIFSQLTDPIVIKYQNEGAKVFKLVGPWCRVKFTSFLLEPLLMNRQFFLFIFYLKIYKLLKIKNLPKLMKSPFHRLLSSIKPKVIVGTYRENIFWEAARALDIPTFEVLHGFGFDGVPWDYDRKNLNYLPSNIVALDQKTYETFLPMEERGIKVYNLEHPINLINIYKELNIEPILKKRSAFDKQILVTVQWGHDGSEPGLPIFSNGFFPEVLLECVRIESSVFWRFRLHPVLMRSRTQRRQVKALTKMLDSFNNVDWRESSDALLPILFINTHAHITVNSGTAYEAAAFGVKTLALDPRFIELPTFTLYDDLVSTGMVTVNGDPSSEQILAWIRHLDKAVIKSTPLVKNYTWKVLDKIVFRQ